MRRGCGPAAISRCENRSCSGNLRTASIPGTSSPSSSNSAPSTGRPLPPTTSCSTPSLPWRKTSPSGGMCRKCSTTRQSGLTGRSHGVGARRQRYLTAAGFLLPAAVGICLFSILPIAQALRISFFDYSLLSPQQTATGLENYERAWADPVFQIALRNTLLYTGMLVLAQTGAALTLALLLKQRVAGLAFFRSAFFAPVVTSLVVVSTVWKLMYNSQGFLNGLLSTLGLSPQPFLASTMQARTSCGLMSGLQNGRLHILIPVNLEIRIPSSAWKR